MAITTSLNITNLQEKVIGAARMTLKDDVLAIKDSFWIERGQAGMDDTFNSPKLPGVTAFGLTEGVDMVSETLVDSNVAVSATEVGASVWLTKKMLRTVNSGDFMRRAGKAIGSGINVKEEQDFATLIDGFGNVVGLDGASATWGNVGAGLAQLRNNTEPVNEVMMRDVSVVVSPYGWHDLSQLLFPTGSGESHAPNTATPPSVAERAFKRFLPVGDYFGSPIKVSTNLVASTNDIRSGIFYKEAGLVYEFMPVDMEVDDSDKSMRALEMIMVVDYGFGEVTDGFGREFDHDNVAPTS